MKRFLTALGIIALAFLTDQGGRPEMVCRLGVCTPTVVAEAPGPSQALFNSPYYSCSTNRYVSTTGSDANNGTASDNAHAWLTLAHANSAVPSAGWCINVLPGTYATGVSITNGGNTASSSGYVVYRCNTTLNGCTITDTGGQTNNSAIAINASYVMVDGFTFNGGNGTGVNTIGIASCQDSSCGFGNTSTTTPVHHIWALNNVIHGYGQAGIELANGEYFYTIHNTIFDNSHDCQAAQGSGESVFLPVVVPSYSRTTDDGNNKVSGPTGNHFHIFTMWNVFYNNYIGCTTPPVTDGNGFIADDWFGDQFGICSTATCVYTSGGLVAFNITYNNGGIGIHIFESPYVTVSNNSVFNNVIDTVSTNQGFRGNLDDDGSYGSIQVNNASYASCGAGILSSNSAIGIYGIDSSSNYVASTTVNHVGGVLVGDTSIIVTSAAQFPNGTTFNGAPNNLVYSADYSLPGGNLIKIDSEVMWVTAGWGTTTWTVTRGYNGTPAASHANGATIQWLQQYYSNNITKIVPTCTEIDNTQGSSTNNFYSSTANKQATSPGWIDVGNTSFGSESTQPNGTNFALAGGSAAIGYSITVFPFNFLSGQSVDAGACYHTLTTCP